MPNTPAPTPPPADAALLREPLKPADAALLYDIANAALDDAAARETDGLMRVVAISAHAAARLRALADQRFALERAAPTDAQVERAALEIWGGEATPSGHATPWRDRYMQWQHDDLLTIARRALTAALEVDAL
jgi:hypothetical protein